MNSVVIKKLLGGALRWAGAVLVLGVLVWVCAGVVRDKLAVVREVKFVGHADEAAYATMGQSLAEGRGLDVNYVSWFFIPYPKSITRQEDHWPPFMGLAIAPFFKAYGVSAYASKMAPILIGTLLLPVLTAALGMAYSKRGYVGLIAGLLMLANGTMFSESMKTLADVPAAMLLTGFCWALIAARERPGMHVVAGVFAAGAYYAKGSEIILLGLYPVATVLICGVKGWAGVRRMLWIGVAASVPLAAAALWGYWKIDVGGPLKAGWVVGAMMAGAVVLGAILVGMVFAHRRGWMWTGLATAVLLMAPFWYANWRNYGNPLHSTQNYVSGYIGLVDPNNIGWGWEVGTYSAYWGKDLPRVSDRWTKYGDGYWDVVRGNREAFARWALLGPSTSRESWADWGAWGLKMRDFVENGLGGTPTPVKLRRVRRWGQPEVASGSMWERASAEVQRWQEPLCEVPGAAALGFAGLLVVGTPIGVLAGWGWKWWKGKRVKDKSVKEGETDQDRKHMGRGPPPPANCAGPWHPAGAKQGQDAPATSWLLGPTLALVMMVGVQWLFLVMFWQRDWMNRLMFVALPILAVIGVTGLGRIIELPMGALLGLWKLLWPGRFPRWLGYWHVALTAVVAIYICLHVKSWKEERVAKIRMEHGANYPWCDEPGSVSIGQAMDLGEYFKEHLPKAVFMSRYPWQMLFYAGKENKAVNVPLADAKTIFAIAK